MASESGYKRKVFDPRASEPFRISRSKIDLFVECPRCFYLEQRLGVPRPSWPAFSLNNAVDELMKREFDALRERGEPHPLMKKYGIDAVPLKDARMDEWRDALRRGVQFHHPSTNLVIRGGVDDVWVDKNGELFVVDYKATSKKSEVTIEGYWQQSYKRQVEVYQWLLRQIGENVSDTAYFVYANGISNADAFDGKLEFETIIIPYKGSADWVEGMVEKIHRCLMSLEIPQTGERCEYCPYREAAGKTLQAIHRTGKASKEQMRKATPKKSGPKSSGTQAMF